MKFLHGIAPDWTSLLGASIGIELPADVRERLRSRAAARLDAELSGVAPSRGVGCPTLSLRNRSAPTSTGLAALLAHWELRAARDQER